MAHGRIQKSKDRYWHHTLRQPRTLKNIHFAWCELSPSSFYSTSIWKRKRGAETEKVCVCVWGGLYQVIQYNCLICCRFCFEQPAVLGAKKRLDQTPAHSGQASVVFTSGQKQLRTKIQPSSGGGFEENG